MIPKINNRGHSFKGIVSYLMHDKDANTSERVAWSETGNLHTDDIEKAALVMAWTDKSSDSIKLANGGSLAGRKSEAGAVYHYSLAWEYGATPSQEHQRGEALKTLDRLGLKSHQYFIVSHDDTKHSHIHIVANLTNPETGRRHTPSFDKRELSTYALEYERAHGLQCKQREENAAKRERGEHVKHQDTRQDYSAKITAAYNACDNGASFSAALTSEGLTLAQGRRGGFVIVDDGGDIQKLARQIEGVKTKEIKAKLLDLDIKALPDAEELAAQVKTINQERIKTETQEEESKAHDRERRPTKESSKSPKEVFNGVGEKGIQATFNEGAKPAQTQARSISDNAPHTTRERARAVEQLAHDPLQNLRGGLGEAGTAAGGGLPRNDSVPFGQARNPAADNALLPLREKKASYGWFGGVDAPSVKLENSERKESTALKAKQIAEKREYEQYLRMIDSDKEAAHRAHWQAIIDEETTKKHEARQALEQKGFMGFIHRLRYGNELRQEHQARLNNLENAQMRLSEGVRNLSSQDRLELEKLDKTHGRARDELKIRQEQDIKAAGARKDEKVQELTEKAQTPPEQRQRAKNPMFSSNDNAPDLPIVDFAKLKNGKTLEDEWKEAVHFTDAEDRAAGAQQQNISVEALEEQNAQQAYQKIMDAEIQDNPQNSQQEDYNRIMEQSDEHSEDEQDNPPSGHDIER